MPIVSDVGGFAKGLAGAKRDADKFTKGTLKQFSLTGTGIHDALGKAHTKLDALGKTNLGMLTKGLAGLTAAAIASAGAIATIGFKNIGQVGKDALSLGTSAEALSRLRGVARATGTDVDDLGEFIKGLTADVHDSIGKTTEAGEAMKALGTSAEQLSKMAPDEQIKKLNQGFAALPNDAERARVAMRLAGQGGVKMFRMLSAGTREFKDAFDNAPIVTGEDVSEIRRLQIAIDKISASVQSLADTFTTVLAPRIASVAEILEGFASKFGIAVKAAAKPATAPTKASGPARPAATKADASAPNSVVSPAANPVARQAKLEEKLSKSQALEDARRQGRLDQGRKRSAIEAAREQGKIREKQRLEEINDARELAKAKARANEQMLADARKLGAKALVPGKPGDAIPQLGGGADEAREQVKQLQERFDKQSAALARKPGHTVGRPTTNGGYKFEQSNQKDVDRHNQTGQELSQAKARAARLSDEAKSVSGAMSDAMRLNKQMLEDVAALKQDYRQSIESAGKDEIHRRVDQIKGLNPDQRKQLVQQGLLAREANKTSALRDELQESTKLPIEKLGEDLARIDEMVRLGAANGGLTRAQGIRAAAMKTRDSGLAGGETRFAGALQANSIEGRSYLLSQAIGKPESMLETARQGLAATMQGNGYLARIARDLGQSLAGNDMVTF